MSFVIDVHTHLVAHLMTMIYVLRWDDLPKVVRDDSAVLVHGLIFTPNLS